MPDLLPESPVPPPAKHPPVAPTEPQSPGPDTFLAALDESLYQKTRDVLAAPETAGSARAAWVWLLVTLGLFALSFWWRADSAQTLGLVVLVLLLHESGHFLGMRLFGYRNVRMFFIPFFGAAVSGQKHAAPVWQQAVVLLLGPLPGIFVGLALVLALGVYPHSPAGDLALWLLVINGFNLLPLVPLDGGRFLDLLLFSRRAALSAGFQVVAACGLGALAWWGGTWVLGVVAALMLLAAPARYRKAQIERVFAGNPARMPPRFEDLDDGQRRELFGWAVLLNRLTRTPAGLAAEVRQLHEHMVARPAGAWVWAALVLLYLGGWAAGVGGLVGLKHNNTRETERIVTELVTDFEHTTDEIIALQREANRLREAANADPAGAEDLRVEAAQKTEDADHEWEQLVGRWMGRPETARAEALSVLLTHQDLGNLMRRLSFVRRMVAALDAHDEE
jgi:Zn-dependent protease